MHRANMKIIVPLPYNILTDKYIEFICRKMLVSKLLLERCVYNYIRRILRHVIQTFIVKLSYR